MANAGTGGAHTPEPEDLVADRTRAQAPSAGSSAGRVPADPSRPPCGAIKCLSGQGIVGSDLQVHVVGEEIPFILEFTAPCRTATPSTFSSRSCSGGLFRVLRTKGRFPEASSGVVCPPRCRTHPRCRRSSPCLTRRGRRSVREATELAATPPCLLANGGPGHCANAAVSAQMGFETELDIDITRHN